MVNFQKVDKQLKMLDNYLSILSRLSKINRNEFINDPHNYGSAERFLQLAAIAALCIMKKAKRCRCK